MHRFWSSIIEPILAALGPQAVVEIGSDRGSNTRNLAEFCRRRQAVLHAIDPNPGFDVCAYARRYAGHFVFHQGLSLDRLPQVGAVDAVLIDGDHNWYTVYGELKLIEALSVEHGRPFPVVLLHDIGWPYGRRDLYYAPDRIPESFRKPYRRAGLVMNAPALQMDRGLNSHMDNATDEGGARNGVLTAIEDFQRETSQSLRLVQLPGFNGLGILVPGALLAQNEALAALVERLAARGEAARTVRMLERQRLKLEIVAQALERVKQRDRGAAPGKALATLAKWATRGVEWPLDRVMAAGQAAGVDGRRRAQ